MLLTKDQILAAAGCASADETRPVLNGIHLHPEYIESSDGHIHVRIPVKTTFDAEYPQIAGFAGPSNPKKAREVILPAKLLAKAAKHIPKSKSLDILNHLAVDAAHADGKVQIATTDLDASHMNEMRAIEGPYPDTDDMLKNSVAAHPVLARVTFNANILAQMIDVAQRLSDSGLSAITLEMRGPDRAMSFTVWGRGRNVVAQGVVMPLCFEAPEPEPVAETAEREAKKGE